MGVYQAPASLGLNEFALGGPWNVGSQSVTPDGGGRQDRGRRPGPGHLPGDDLRRQRSEAGARAARGHPDPSALRGSDVGPGGYFTVRGQRLYNLVRFKTDEQTVLTVELPRGISAYDFTFG